MEYKVLMAPELVSEEQLNQLFQQGSWTLITIVQAKGQFYFYFVRPVIN